MIKLFKKKGTSSDNDYKVVFTCDESLIPKSSCWHKFGVCSRAPVIKFL